MAVQAAEGWMLPLLFAALGLALGSFFSSVFSSLFTHPRPTWPFSALQVVCADCRKPASFSGSKASGACVSLGSDRKTEKQRKSFLDSCQSQLDVSLHSFKNAAKEDQSNFCLEVTGDISNPIPRAVNNCDSPNLKPDPYHTTKRQGYLSWDDYFMAIAFLSAHRSKDPNRQVGACLVSQDRVILGIGYNGFPRGCSDDELPWAKMAVNGDPLQTKYPYVCHAEVNAILNKNHASACGQRLYVTMFPCNECAKIIIQAGVAEVVYFTSKSSSSDCSYIASQRLLSLAGVKVWQHLPEKQRLILEFK